MKIGDRIKQRRIELGMSQEELAKKMGYKTRNAIYQFEQKDNMKLSIVKKFASALDTTPSELMGWNDDDYEHITYDIPLDAYEPEFVRRAIKFLQAYNHAIPEIQSAIDSLLKSDQSDS